MEIALLVIAIVLLLAVLVSIVIGYKNLVKKQKEDQQILDENKLDATISGTISKNLLDITNQFNVLKTDINNQITNINKSINDNLKDNTEENKNHLKNVVESLTKITESSKNLEVLNNQLNDLKKVLNVSQLTGRYGEEILENILAQVFGETHGIYEIQKTLTNGKKPDAIVNFPAPINKVCIDSKFNFSQFNNLFFAEKEVDVKLLKQSFRTEIRKEIDKISFDYYIKDETSDFVILFMPNDSIFNYIQNDSDLYENVYVYARKKNVILTAPSSLQPILLTMNTIRINIQTKDNLDEILKSLSNFKDEISRLGERYDRVMKNLETMNKTANECKITVDKVVSKTTKILQECNLDEE